MHNNINWREWLLVIPARLDARRLPRKPLQDLCGKPLVVRVFENLLPLKQLGATITVATDHDDIYTACTKADVPVVMTSDRHLSGTDRCFEVSRSTEHPFIMNVQGDQPFLSLQSLEDLASCLRTYGKDAMATLVQPSRDRKAFENPNCVKVVQDHSKQALYFSRSCIPYLRDQTEGAFQFYHHIGIYAFTRDSLAQFCGWPAGYLEKLEKLEQLRALENGMPIILTDTNSNPQSIDTEDDLKKARELWRNRH